MRFFKLLFSKAMFVALAIILQVAIFFVFVLVLNEYYLTFQIISIVLGLLVFLGIINKNCNPEYKIPWLVTVLCIPLFGTVLYIIFSKNGMSKITYKRFIELEEESENLTKQTIEEKEKIRLSLDEYASQSYAIENMSRLPAYSNTRATFCAQGEEFFASLLADLKNAKKFIFMEYFIIDEGEMWGSILEVLKQKVKEGVDVRILYDDIGCMGKIKSGYYKKLRKMGIKAYKFNRFKPIISSIHNNRDHRKITVIDGVISYTGGINLADEYINKKSKFGHWKDTAIRLEGEASKSFTLLFLQNYTITSKKKENFDSFVTQEFEKIEEGIFQPFGDGPRPLYENRVGEDTLINLIGQAKERVTISTPYLICDYNLLSALERASRRGVKVQIIMPSVPDKKIIWYLSRSNYKQLMNAGVEIYEYAPGFIHSKVILVDEEIAIVGTINLDYRSLVHHYECGVLIYKSNCLLSIKEDLEDTLLKSIRIDDKSAKQGFLVELICSLFKVFSPLL